MDSEYAKKLLIILQQNSNRILNAGFGIREVESTFFDVVKLVRDHNDLRPFIVAQVESMVTEVFPGAAKDSLMPSEMVQFLAHELRWEEFKSLAEQRIRERFDGDSGMACSDLSQLILDSMTDDWEDREFYPRYSVE